MLRWQGLLKRLNSWSKARRLGGLCCAHGHCGKDPDSGVSPRQNASHSLREVLCSQSGSHATSQWGTSPPRQRPTWQDPSCSSRQPMPTERSFQRESRKATPQLSTLHDTQGSVSAQFIFRGGLRLRALGASRKPKQIRALRPLRTAWSPERGSVHRHHSSAVSKSCRCLSLHRWRSKAPSLSTPTRDLVQSGQQSRAQCPVNK